MVLEELIRRQAGVLSRAQALAGGLSDDQVNRRLADRRWYRVHPGVYLAGHRDFGAEARIRAAALWAGQGATVSGLAAAWWHGVSAEEPGIVEVTMPRARGLRRARGVRVRRRDLAEIDRVEVRGVTVTGVPLTVLETAVDLGSRFMDRALQRRVSYEALAQAHSRNLGRRGSAAAAGLLVAAADRAASDAERRVVGLLRDAGLTGWLTHYLVDGYELDFAFPEDRLAIEVDGWAWHHEVERFRRDRQRQNALVLAGWTVLRFTWHDLTQRPDEVVAEIRAGLGDRQFGLVSRARRG